MSEAPPREPWGALSDEDVVARVRAGATDLFQILLRRYNQRLYRVARGVLRDDAEAEDVVQEAWVRAFANLGQFAGRARFSTWLTRIALYEAWARARRRSRIEGFDTECVATSDPISSEKDPERLAAEREAAMALEKAIESLPEGYRSVFVLREVEELSTAEAAACLELTEETVKTRLHRARARLRRELSHLALPRSGVFPFLGARCDRMVERVFARLSGLRAARGGC